MAFINGKEILFSPVITGTSAGSTAIIHVEVLPTEKINSNAFYRTSEGIFWYDGEWHELSEKGISEGDYVIENGAIIFKSDAFPDSEIRVEEGFRKDGQHYLFLADENDNPIKLGGVFDPESDFDAANKRYVDNSTSGKQDKLSFDGAYDKVTNKVATVKTVTDAIQKLGSGSGGVSSWNDLTDKPFGEKAVETFSVSNKPHREMGGVFSMGTYGLATDTVVPAVDELGSYSADVTFIYGEAQNTESVTYVLSEFVVENLNGGYKLTKSSPVNTPDAIVFVVSDYATFIANYALEVERNGIYAYSTERDYSTPSYTSFANVTAIHKTGIKTLDEKYIPDTIARVSDIPEGGSLVQIKRWEAND